MKSTLSRSHPGFQALALLVTPILAFFALHLRAMSPAGIPDPATESAFLWDPLDLYRRFSFKVFTVGQRAYIGPRAAYFRWGTRAGFLVPGRLAFLTFGAVPGFFVFRYLLILVAIVPAYLIARRLWGTWAGVLAVVVILTSPVLITAWGTDFTDSAAVSYLLGGTACLLMPSTSIVRRRWWLAGSALLLTAAVWSLGTTALLIGVNLAVWGIVRFLRDRRGLGGDVLTLGIAALGATFLLSLGSLILFGHFDFIVPTIKALLFLDTPAQQLLWHSTSSAWAPYDPYLLVLPAVVLAWIVVVGLSRTARRPEVVVIGLAATGQLLLATFLQFFGGLEILEEHFISSSLWATSLLALIVVLAELAKPLTRQKRSQLLTYVPAALVVLVALVSELLPTPPAFKWSPYGYILVVAVLVACALALWPGRRAAAIGLSTVIVMAALLALTVTPEPARIPVIPGVVNDPPPAYAGALGGSATMLIDRYRLEYEVRQWAPNATYQGEQLLTCPTGPLGAGLQLQIVGMFHSGDNLLSPNCAESDPSLLGEIEARKAAQILVISTAPLNLRRLLSEISILHPVVAKQTVLRSGNLTCRLWLVEIPSYIKRRAV